MITGAEKCMHEARVKEEGGQFILKRRQIKEGVTTAYKVVDNREAPVFSFSECEKK